MKLNIVKLSFKQAVALTGRRSGNFIEEVNTIASDTIKAALVSCLSINEEKLLELNQNLIVSSAYPFLNHILFFPKPYLPHPFKKAETNPAHQKNIKKIRFIDQKLFEAYIQARHEIDLYAQEQLDNYKFLISEANKEFINNIRQKDQSFKVLISETEEHVTLGVSPYFETEKGDPFYVSRTFFHDSKEIYTGLWFAYFLKDEKSNTVFKQALQQLSLSGLGAYTTYGNGLFEYEHTQTEITLPQDATHLLTLSKYIPTEEEINNHILEKGNYNILIRNGYIAGAKNESKRHWQKKQVWMINEGAVFESDTLEGKNLEVAEVKEANKTEHRVYRDGRPFAIPCKIPENNANNE